MTDDSEVPFINNTEQVDTYFPQGTGATPIFLVGKSPITKDTTKLYTFHTYDEAVALPANGGLGPEAVGNDILAALKILLGEGSVTDEDDDTGLGIDTVYVVNVGNTPTVDDWTAAQTLSEKIEDPLLIEVYAGNSDMSFINTTQVHMSSMDSSCSYRLAVFSNAATTIADAAKETDPTQTTYIRNSRIYIHYDPTKQMILAADIACTPYYEDPAKRAYRTVKADDILSLSLSDKNTLIMNGLVCDMPSLTYKNGVRMAKPIKVVSTAYRLGSDGKRAADANVHQRRNADYTWNQCDELAKSELYNNNTPDGLKFIKEEVLAYLANQETLGYLSNPTVTVESVPSDLEAIKLYRSAQFVNSIYKIEQTSEMQAD